MKFTKRIMFGVWVIIYSEMKKLLVGCMESEFYRNNSEILTRIDDSLKAMDKIVKEVKTHFKNDTEVLNKFKRLLEDYITVLRYLKRNIYLNLEDSDKLTDCDDE